MSAALERYRVAIVVTLFLLLATGGVVIYLRRPVAQAIEILETSPSPADSVQLAVYVSGAVVDPGVYYLPEESRVQDALQAAGGPTAEADLDRVNLAQRLHDEDHIYFPTLGEENVPLTNTTGPAAALIDINKASAAELETLPGIGPTLAQAIVEYREGHGPFATIEEITDVQGIGQGIFEDIRSLITVG